MSDTNRTRLSYGLESAYGTLPNISLTDIRHTGESLRQDTRTASSSEIRQDRQIPDVIRTAANVSGDINIEMSYGAHDDFLQWAMLSAGWSSVVTVGPVTNVSAASADNSFNSAAAGFGSIVAGQWIKVSGFANAANNGYFKVVTQTASKLVVSGGTLVVEAAGPTVNVVMGGQIVNGVALNTFALERQYVDLGNVRARYHGCAVEAFNLAIAAEAIITGSFGIMGQQESSGTTSFGSGYTLAPSNGVMNAIDDVPKIIINGSTTVMNSLSMAAKNNLRGRMVIGNVGPVSIGTGSFDITGTAQVYFSDATLITHYLSFNRVPISWVMEDSTGKAYVIELPAVKFTSGQRVAGQQNADVIADLAFTAYRHSTDDITMRIARFAA